MFLVLVLAATGCQKRVLIAGRVLEDGRPVPSAELRWAHATDQAVFVSGVTDPEGNYILDAAGKKDIPTGKYQVTVTWWRTKDGKPLPTGEQGTALKGTAAAKQFSATVEVEVTAATSTLDVDVSGKSKAVEGAVTR